MFLPTPKKKPVRRPPGGPMNAEIVQELLRTAAAEASQVQPRSSTEQQTPTTQPEISTTTQINPPSQPTFDFEFFHTNRSKEDNHFALTRDPVPILDIDEEIDWSKYAHEFDSSAAPETAPEPSFAPAPAPAPASAPEPEPVDPILYLLEHHTTVPGHISTRSQAAPAFESPYPPIAQAAPQGEAPSSSDTESTVLSTIFVQTEDQPAPVSEPGTVPEGSLNPPPPPPPATDKGANKTQQLKNSRKRNIDQVASDSAPSGPAGKKRATAKSKAKVNEKSKEKSKGKANNNPKDKADGKPKQKANNNPKDKASNNPKEKADEPKEKRKSEFAGLELPDSFKRIRQARQDRRQHWLKAFSDNVGDLQTQAQDILNTLYKARDAGKTKEKSTKEQAKEKSTKEQAKEKLAEEQAAAMPSQDQSTGVPVSGQPSASASQQHAQHQPQHQSQAQPQNQTQVQPQGQPQVQPENQPQVQPQAQPENQPQPENLSDNQPENQPQNQPQNQPKNQSENQSQEQDPLIKPAGHFENPDNRRKLKIGGVTLQRAGLGLSPFTHPVEIHRRLSHIDKELELQKTNAPILPPSELTQPGPKPFTPRPYQVPQSIKDPRVREFFDKKNIALCTKNKQIDLERNNQAAKGTRNRREEALNMYRELANDIAVERNWWRLKAISLGADYRDYDSVPPTVKENMVTEMEQRVKKTEALAAKEAKKRRSSVHSARNTEQARLAKEDDARKKQEIKEVAAAFAAGDFAEIERMSDPDYKATVPASRSASRPASRPASRSVSRSAATRRTTRANTRKAVPKEASVTSEDTETNSATNHTAVGTVGEIAATTYTIAAINTMGSNNVFGDSSNTQGSTGFVPPQLNVTSAPLYKSVPISNPQPSDFMNGSTTGLVPLNNHFGNSQIQGNQPSNVRQEVSEYHGELPRQSSNTMVADVQPNTSQPPAHFNVNMPVMVEESPYWAATDAFDSSTLPPNTMNHNLQYLPNSMDVNMSMQGSFNNSNTLPQNTMNHNWQGPLDTPNMLPPNSMDMSMDMDMNASMEVQGSSNDAGTLPPNNVNHNFQGSLSNPNAPPLNTINQSPGNLMHNMSWYDAGNTVRPSNLDPRLFANHQNNGYQNESLTNNAEGSDQFDINADASTFPDPIEEVLVATYLQNADSTS